MTNKGDLEISLQRLSPVATPWFLLAMGTCAAEVLFCGFRQIVTLRVLTKECGYWRLVMVTYAGAFANMLLPGGTGLDACRLVYLRHPTGVGYARLGGWVVLDKLITAVAIFFVALGTILLAYTLGLLPLSHIFLLTVALNLGGIVISFLLFAILRSWRVSSLVERIARRWHFIETLRRIVRLLELKNYDRRDLIRALAFAILGRAVLVLGVGFLAYPIFGLEGACLSIALSPIVMAANQLPVTPGNLGWTEAAAALVWQLFNANGGVVIFLLWRMLQMLFAVGGAPVVFWMQRRKKDQEGEGSSCQTSS